MNIDRIVSSTARYALLAGAVLGTGCSASTQSASAPPPEAEEGLALATRVYESPDPAGAYAALSDEERAKVNGVTKPGVLEITETLADERGQKLRAADVARPDYSGCYGWHQTYGRKALLGNTLYTYWQSTSVCVSNGTVTSVSVYDDGGETSTPGWRIAHNPTTATENVGWEGRGKAQYYFVLGAGGWDIQNPTDCIQQRLNGNGHDHLSSSSCDLG